MVDVWLVWDWEEAGGTSCEMARCSRLSTARQRGRRTFIQGGGAGVSRCVVRPKTAHSQAGVWPSVEDFLASLSTLWVRSCMAAGAKRGVKRDELGGTCSMP